METATKLETWRDWSFFGLHWAYLLAVAVILFVASSQTNSSLQTYDIAFAFALSAAANLFLVPFIQYQSLRSPLSFFVIVRDMLTVAAFVGLTNGESLLLVAVVAPVIFSGFLRLGLGWGAAQTIAVLIAALLALQNLVGSNQLAALLNTLTVPILLVGLFAFIAGLWGYTLQKESGALRQHLGLLASTRGEELSDLQERTRGLYEVAETLSATMDYQRILDAAMDAGRLGLRQLTGQRIVSMVMLFRVGDNKLQVITSRGLARTDAGRPLPGVSGIIGTALRECIPITGDHPEKDPELQYFIAFHGLRSVLCIPLRSGFQNFGVLIYASDAPNAFNTQHIELLTAIGTQATIALQNAVLYSNLAEEKERIVEVEEEARKQLARDLHDGPVQTISAIAMRVSYFQRMMEKTPEQVPQELAKIEQLARGTVKEIRHMLFTLRPLVLETQGLGAALRQLAEKMEETHSQRVVVYIGRDVESMLTKQQQGVIFYIIDEAVNNARKHAEAQRIMIDISHRDDLIVVQIIDNGVGFDMGSVDDNYEGRGSLGMVNMRERAELLDASLQVESAEGSGTTVTLIVPTKERHVPERRGLSLKTPMTRLAAAALQRIESLSSSR